MNLWPIFLALQTNRNILRLMQISLGFLQSSKWTQLHWDLKRNLRGKECNQLLRRLDVDCCTLGCSNIWINPPSICYSFSLSSLLTSKCWANPNWKRGRFGQLLCNRRCKLTPLHISVSSSHTESSKSSKPSRTWARQDWRASPQEWAPKHNTRVKLSVPEGLFKCCYYFKYFPLVSYILS